MIKWINLKGNKKGFTLVELVVVIAILGILAAIAVPKLTTTRDKAKWSAHAANIRTIESAITIYQADGNDIKQLTINEDGKVVGKEESSSNNFVDDYLQRWPTKPGFYTIKEGVVKASPTVADTKNNIDNPDFTSFKAERGNEV